MFACFTGTKVQILTQKVLGASDADVVADYVLSEGIDEIALGVRACTYIHRALSLSLSEGIAKIALGAHIYIYIQRECVYAHL